MSQFTKLQAYVCMSQPTQADARVEVVSDAEREKERERGGRGGRKRDTP